MALQPPAAKAAVRPLHLPPHETRARIERRLRAALRLHAFIELLTMTMGAETEHPKRKRDLADKS